MRSPLAGLLIALPCVALPPLTLPCLWDRDTLAVEAAGATELVEVLVGRFDRWPDAYYAQRLARVEVSLAAEPADLALYDDAGVACDRLGRGDEAVEWMARKRAALDALQVSDAFHEYTYLANLGTFHAHRWLRAGRDPARPADLERARDLIAAAIALNPDAHFGRERYQLLAIEELLEPTVRAERRDEPVTIVTRLLAEDEWVFPAGRLADSGYADAVEGLAGLVRLGDAWESPLIWASLEHALQDRGDAFLARLSALRVVELARAGRPPGPDFDEARYLSEGRAYIEDRDLEPVDRWWRAARGEADAWRAARAAYAGARLTRGEHPDTHAGFWDDWRDVHALPAPPAAGRTERIDRAERIAIAIALATLALLVLGVAALVRRHRARRAPAARASQ